MFLEKEIKKEAKDAEWWMSQTKDIVDVDLFDSFGDARSSGNNMPRRKAL